MLRVERQFETLVFGCGDQEPPMRHYAVAQVAFEVPVWHVRLLRPGSPPDSMERWEHYVVTQALLAAGILVCNRWLKAEVKVLLPGYMSDSGQLELAECKSLWEGHETGLPNHKVCLFETDQGLYVDPPGELQVSDVIRVNRYWPGEQMAA